MITVLLNEGCKPCHPSPTICMHNPAMLLNLAPEFQDSFIPQRLRLCKDSIDLVFSHNAVTHTVHDQEFPIVSSEVSPVGIYV